MNSGGGPANVESGGVAPIHGASRRRKGAWNIAEPKEAT